MKAVVALGLNRISVEEVTLDPPKAGEVLVKMGATGVCHSDLSAVNGTLPMALPLLLGHEGAGVVQIDESIPFTAAALVGSGVMTGVGAVTGTARVEPGSTVAVFGCGGVGLSAI